MTNAYGPKGCQHEACNCASCHPAEQEIPIRPLPAAERAVVEAAMALTLTAHEMGVVDPVSHIAVGMDLRKYAAKEHAVFDACSALAKLRQGAEPKPAQGTDVCAKCREYCVSDDVPCPRCGFAGKAPAPAWVMRSLPEPPEGE